MTKLPDSSSSFATFEVAILLRLRSDPLRNLWDQVEFEQLLREISESARLGAEGGCGWIGGRGWGWERIFPMDLGMKWLTNL